jgi:hypothetical protein
MNLTNMKYDSLQPLYQTLTCIILYLITIWTIIGNLLILISISINKKLKKNGTSNILIGNLAFSDLLLGLTVLPFSALATSLKVWKFGQILCEIWFSFDVLCCTASIWSLTMISIDRYIATNHPIKYRIHKNNTKIGIAYISTVWLISIMISFGSFLMYKNHKTSNSINSTTLINDYSSLFKQIKGTNDFTCASIIRPSFVILSSIVSFYLPLVLMVILYSKVFFKIRSLKSFRMRHAIKKNIFKSRETCNLNMIMMPSHLNLISNIETKETLIIQSQNDLKIISSETRITKTLAIVMTSFLICWLPFFITYNFRALLNDPNLVSIRLMDTFVWLGYSNSSIDPILYLILNEHFRYSFFCILTFRIKSN